MEKQCNTYQEWLDFIQTNHDPHYWENILKYHSELLMDMMLSKQHLLQKKLRLNAQQLSTVKHLIGAYHKVNHNKVSTPSKG